jgi:hypothetical protein
MNGSVTPGYYFRCLSSLNDAHQKLIPRPSCSRIPMTSLRSVPPNLLNARAVAPTSKSATSRSLAYPLTMLNHTTSGSLTSTSGERPISSTLLYVGQMIWGPVSPPPPQIGDHDRKIATLYDMLDYQDASNVDKKGLPLTVNSHPSGSN